MDSRQTAVSETGSVAATMQNTSPLLKRLTFSLIVVMLAFMALRFQFPAMLAGNNEACDFHAFYIAGKMVINGNIEDAYHYELFAKEQDGFFGKRQGFLAWTYPPPFNLIAAILAALPIGAAYFMFTGASLCAYIFALRKISPAQYIWSIIAVLPAIMLNIRLGQNGLLTASLIGFSLSAFMRQRATAGLPLGLMVIKPHLALGVALMTCLSRRWPTISIAATTTTIILALTTGVFGISIWPAFFNGIDEARRFLWNGTYPLERMTSIYALVYTLGSPPKIAMVAQAISALTSCAAIVVACIKIKKPLHLIGITAIASLYISPYGFDYDMTLLGIGVAAFMPDISRRASGLEIALLLTLCWFSCGAGVALKMFFVKTGGSQEVINYISSYSIASILLTAMLAVSAIIIRRPERQQGIHES